MYKMKVIAPYDGMGQLVLAEKKKYPDFDIDLEIADREKGIEIARRAEREGYDIILSRGGTAELIEANISIPVISVKISGYDLMRVIRLTQNDIGATALIGFSHITRSAKTACSLVHADIDIYTINSEEEAKTLLYELSNKNYKTFIGDVTINRIAQTLGLNSILITTGQESLDEAFKEAERMIVTVHTVKEKNRMLSEALEKLQEGVFVFDRSNQCIFKNRMARNFDMYEIISPYLQVAWRHPIDIIEERDGIMYQIYSALKGEELLYIYVKDSIEIKQNLRGVTLKNPQNVMVPFGAFSTKSDVMKETIENAKRLALLDSPVLIIGEVGTGKSQMAYSIHCFGTNSFSTFIQIDCQLTDCLDEEEKQKILRLDNAGTWYFENVQYMDKKHQEWLLSLIRQGFFESRHRLICSGSPAIERRVKEGEFSEALFNLMCSSRLDVPGLRERVEDVADITSLAINKANAKYGKHIVTLEPEALLSLQHNKWDGNIEQLIQFIDMLVMKSNGDIISLKDVENALESLRGSEVKEDSEAGWRAEIDLDQMLDEIINDVIRCVVKKVNGNQSEAAKRLGISRSTLWRKLQ